MALAPGTRLGPYELTALIGAGGMGEVYRANDTALKRHVALKVLPSEVANDPERVARFQREAQILAVLNHPNIAHIHGLERSSGTIALVLELVEGPTLADRIAKGPIPLKEALPIARQIANALEAAHDQSIIHRDLKPTNIKVRDDGTVKVLDFGLAKALEQTSAPDQAAVSSFLTELRNASKNTSTTMLTSVGMILGTAAYMSPEQAAGRPTDRRTDIWAFGVVLLEMLTGRPVFTGDTASQLIAAVLKDEPDWRALPRGTPDSVRRVLRRCLEKDGKRRLDSAAAIRLELDEALASGAETAPNSPRRRGLATGLIVGTLGIAALATAVVVLRQAPATIETRPLWFQVRLPADTTIVDGRNAPEWALAPNGHAVVYAAIGPDRVARLWLQSFDLPAPRPLAGTDGGGFPFWSPDGRWIGFLAHGKLLKLDPTGGAVQEICDATIGGASWNRKGEIVIQGGSPRHLLLVRANGGSPVPIGHLPADQEQRYPQFLPDDRHLLFYSVGGAFVWDIDGASEPKKLDGVDGPAVYDPRGYLLYSRGASIIARRFDPERLETRGESVTIATGTAALSADVPTYAVSNTGALAFLPASSANVTQLTWVTRQGQVLGTVGPPAAYQAPALSPNETAVAAEITDIATAQTDIWVLDDRRGSLSRVTSTHGPEEVPVWSPDGTRIAFTSHRNKRVQIFVASLTDGTERVLNGVSGHLVDWRPDGQSLLFQSDSANSALMASPADGGTAAAVGRVATNQAQFSPDGRWVAYTSTESGKSEVYVTAFPTPAQKWQISTNGGSSPRWPSRAHEIFYLAADGKLMAVSVSTGEFEAGTPVPLFEPHITRQVERRTQYAVTPDGQRFLINALVGGAATQSAIQVVLNWTGLLGN